MTGARSHSAEAAAPPSKTSGLLYGLGLGGFVDGILLHEVLQWHHMVSSEYPTNTVSIGMLRLLGRAGGRPAGLRLGGDLLRGSPVSRWTPWRTACSTSRRGCWCWRRRSPPWLPGGRDGERRHGGFTSDWCLPGGACSTSSKDSSTTRSSGSTTSVTTSAVPSPGTSASWCSERCWPPGGGCGTSVVAARPGDRPA